MKSTFFLDRSIGNGCLQLETGDDYFPLDMGDGNYVPVETAAIERSRQTALAVIRSFETILLLREESDPTELYHFFDGHFLRLKKKYHFYDRQREVVSMPVVLFYLTGLEKTGNRVDLRRFQRLQAYVAAHAFEENVVDSDRSIVALLLSRDAGNSILEFYEEKKEEARRYIQQQRAIALNIILPMAEMLRVALMEGVMFVVGLEAAAIFARLARGFCWIWELITALRPLSSYAWLLARIERMAKVAMSAFDVLMTGVDVFNRAVEFVKVFGELMENVIDIFVFEEYAVTNNILLLEGVTDFSDEDDDILFETAKEYFPQ